MRKTSIFALILGCSLAFSAIARDYPDYYPKQGVGRAGEIDAVHFGENRVVIDDIPYQMSTDVVVHSLTAYSVSKFRLRPGVKVAFQVGSSRTITKFWLLPHDYDATRQR